ncbi:MAG: prolyl-tRNA synthetase associated domain-containing protein [Azospirillaceae bacterium]
MIDPAETRRERHTPESLRRHLDELGIASQWHEHDPVFTVEEAKDLRGRIAGGHCKNLFLANKKKRMWLLVCDEDAAVDLKSLGEALGAGRLSFGSADRLRRVLGVEPGAVTPFALANDVAHDVTPVLDAAMLRHEVLNYHPLDNARTVSIARDDLLRFIEACGHEPIILELPSQPLD